MRLNFESFEQTAYCTALVQEKGLQNSEDPFSKYNEETMRFHYGNVAYRDFIPKYSAEGWVKRKIWALPTAAYNGAVKAICHLSQLIFLVISRKGNQDGRLKMTFYVVIRDIQEGIGRIVSLFHDKYGSYLVQQSVFQKKYYDFFVDCPVVNPVKEEVKEIFAPKDISLKRFVDADTKQREEYIKVHNLQDCIAKLEGKTQKIDSILNELDPLLLKEMNLQDLLNPLESSRLKYALLSDEEFDELTVKGISGINTEQFTFINQRMTSGKEESESIESCHLKNSTTSQLIKAACLEIPPKAILETIPSDFGDLFLKDLVNLTPQEVKKYCQELPKEAFLFFSYDQVREIPITELTQDKLNRWGPRLPQKKEQIEVMFNSKGNFKGNQEKFSCFKLNRIQDAIQAGNLTPYCFSLFSNEQLQELSFSKLTEEQKDWLFPANNHPQNLEKFQLIKVSEIQIAIKAETLNEYCFSLLSHKQLQGLGETLLNLTEKQAKWLFYGKDFAKHKEQFACISPNEVQKFLEGEESLNPYFYFLFFDDQLRKLQILKLTPEKINRVFRPDEFIFYPNDSTKDKSIGRLENKRRFKLLDKVRAAIDANLLNDYCLSIVSSNQL